MKMAILAAVGLAVSLGAASAALGQEGAKGGQGQIGEVTRARPAAKAPAAPQVDLKDPTLFVVGYAHLDTQWRWCYPQTIREFIPATLNDNFRLFEKYPSYVFNFSGSRRYQMMREYYPESFERLKKEIAAGRWFPCGSSVDENDANVPSGESLVRQVLYGNKYFRHEFGMASDEYMLPDCFGFPAALPSVLAHCGLSGFSTQKLTWGLAIGKQPFKVGVWNGPDGRGVIAALDPGAYVGEVLENLATSNGWLQRIQNNGKTGGIFADYHYFGTGDRGGAPTERSVEMVEKSVHTPGPIKIVSGPADWLFKAVSPSMRAGLQTYSGELELTEHSAGSLTSAAYMKRWNRKNELLADNAEKASVMAWWLGGRPYPAEKLESAWYLVLGSQMHDILPGTSHPRAYDFSQNDEVLAGNQLSAVLEDAAGVVVGAMDTRGSGAPVVVYNPLSVEREDVVEAVVPAAAGAKGVTVTGPDGKTVPAQVLSVDGGTARVAFVAKAPSVGFAAYRVKLDGEAAGASALKVDEKGLENERYAVKLNEAGDVASIYDKKNKQELLSGPARLGLHYENPKNWPAWNQDWADRQLPTKEFVGQEGKPAVRVVESGPARVALEVTRTLGPSTFTQRISLAAGGDRVEFANDINWAARERSLRAEFPLAVSNPKATFDIQVGTIERPNSHKEQFEYSAHQWMDLTDAKGNYGVTVMNDSKFGCDKPDDHTLRLTLLHTPGTQGGYQDQGCQDVGRHHIVFAVSGHAGDWRGGKSAVEAARVNQPLVAFAAPAHEGALGKSFSLAHVSSDSVRIQAIKKAEEGDEVIVRLRELSGKPSEAVRVAMASPIASVREVDGQERPIEGSRAKLEKGELVTPIGGYELRAFAVKLGAAPAKAGQPKSDPVELAFDTDVAASRAKRGDGAMDGRGAYPAEQLPAMLELEGVTYRLGSAADGKKNAVAANGQEIKLPTGEHDKICLIAASSEGDVTANVEVDGKPVPVRFNGWTGMVGQWDRRLWVGNVDEQAFNWPWPLAGIEPGYIKPGAVAWYSSHYSTPKGDTYYDYCYLFKQMIELPKGATSVRLPKDPRVKVFAATAVRSAGDAVVAGAPLFDALEGHTQDAPVIDPEPGIYTDSREVTIRPRLYSRPGAIRYTLDGSAPTASSPVYEGPFMLHKPATVRAAVVDAAGAVGPASEGTIEVQDRTPPRVLAVVPAYGSKVVKVLFSEPVDPVTVRPQNFVMSPPIEVKGAKIASGGREVMVELASPPQVNTKYAFNVAMVGDLAPTSNFMDISTKELLVRGPAYELAEVKPEQMGTKIEAPNLPVRAGQPFTLNMFVKADKQPENRTVIAGFGRCDGTGEAGGGGRYMTKFASGLEFWSHNRDVPASVPLDLGKWQMLTASYDGKVMRVYKDGKKVAEKPVDLVDDQSVVCVAPMDPWEHKRKFEGQIRGLTIWGEAMGDEAIASLKDAVKLP